MRSLTSEWKFMDPTKGVNINHSDIIKLLALGAAIGFSETDENIKMADLLAEKIVNDPAYLNYIFENLLKNAKEGKNCLNDMMPG